MLRGCGGVALAVAVLTMVSCANEDGNSGVATLPTAPPTAAPTAAPTTVSTSSATTVVSTSTSTESSTTAAGTLPPGTVGLSPDGPWHLVDSAPGVTTPGLVYELMPKLWAFIQVEETDQSTYPWTLTEPDRPIIEAYLQAQLTYYTAITSDPINLELPGWTEFYAGGGSARFDRLAQRRAEGQVADLDIGVVLQPQVLGDERTADTAIVSDCVSDGGVFLMPDGSLAPGSTRGITPFDWGARLRLVQGVWVVVEEGPVVGSCA